MEKNRRKIKEGRLGKGEEEIRGGQKGGEKKCKRGTKEKKNDRKEKL